MPINPITAARFRVGAILGHSNGDGWGTTDGLEAVTSPSIFQPGGDWDTQATRAYWKNIYVFTSAQPFPTTSPGQTNMAVVASESTGEWLEMTIANATSPAGPHPHASPYNYANNQGACYPRYMYEAWPPTPTRYLLGVGSGGTPTGTPTDLWFNQSPRAARGVRHGVEIPLARLWQTRVNDQVGIVKAAFSSTVLNPAEGGYAAHSDWLDPFEAGLVTPAYPSYLRSAMDPNKTNYYAYWTPRERFDWAPSSGRLYGLWVNKMNAAKAALPAGVLMDLEWVMPWFGDNDANTMPEHQLRATWERNVRATISRIRADAVRYGWTQRPAAQVKIVWPRVYWAYNSLGGANWNAPAFCNEVLERIARDDEYMAVLDNTNWKTLSQDLTELGVQPPLGIETSTHFGSRAYVEAAELAIDAIQQMDEDPVEALPVDETITVEEAKARVRRYYGRSRANVDVADDELMQHLNAAMFHCFHQAGDNLWWLERRNRLEITAGGNAIHTFPRFVTRVLFIEDHNDPDYPLRFEMVGHTDQGKLQIHLQERSSGTFWVHYITMPRRLTAESQVLPAPEHVAEWIVVETCRRLAASSSNAVLASFFAGESMQLQQDAIRSMGQKRRMRRLRMRTQRRRPLMGYRSNWTNLSGQDNGQ